MVAETIWAVVGKQLHGALSGTAVKTSLYAGERTGMYSQRPVKQEHEAVALRIGMGL